MRRQLMKTGIMLFAATTLFATQGVAGEEDTMIVTATRTQTELENAPGAVTVIDREMIEEAPRARSGRPLSPRHRASRSSVPVSADAKPSPSAAPTAATP